MKSSRDLTYSSYWENLLYNSGRGDSVIQGDAASVLWSYDMRSIFFENVDGCGDLRHALLSISDSTGVSSRLIFC